MNKQGGIRVEGLPGLNFALLAIPPATDAAANKGLAGWAADEVPKIKNAARGIDRQAKLAANSVEARAGKIKAGGGRRMPNGNGSYGDLFFGAEFGGGARPSTRQFRRYRSKGYWFFPTIEPDEDTTMIDAAADGLDVASKIWAD